MVANLSLQAFKSGCLLFNSIWPLSCFKLSYGSFLMKKKRYCTPAFFKFLTNRDLFVPYWLSAQLLGHLTLCWVFQSIYCRKISLSETILRSWGDFQATVTGMPHNTWSLCSGCGYLSRETKRASYLSHADQGTSHLFWQTLSSLMISPPFPGITVNM